MSEPQEHAEVVVEEVIIVEEVIVERPELYLVHVDGQLREWPREVITYEEVVDLAYPVKPSDTAKFTVTFRGTKRPTDGSLKAGGKVELHHEGGVFSVTPTRKS